jgi:hypothetical protein
MMKRIAKRKKQMKRKVSENEIRIGTPTEKVYQTVKKIAENEGRGIGRQADLMLLAYIEKNKL